MVKLYKIFLGYFSILALIRALTDKNSCKRYVDYLFPYANGASCYHNPEIDMTTPQILNERRIPYENHTVITEDGYILTLIRMPRENPKGVIILQHCLFFDSSVWFLGYHQSVALTLHNAGYELWLPHFRGTILSENHIDPSKTHKDYWNFSFHELGLYDLSATVSYVKNKTGNSALIYIGHSLGSTAAFIYASMKSKDAKGAVKIFITLCSNVFMGGVATPLRYLLPLMPRFQALADWLNYGRFLLVIFPKLVNKLLPVEYPISLLVSWIIGWSPTEIEPDIIPSLLTFGPQPTSLKNLFHYGQLVETDKFQAYDYGLKKNLLYYNSNRPFEYPLQNISVPFYLIDGTEDSMVSKEGIERLYKTLPNSTKVYGRLTAEGLNHSDFIFGASRFIKVYHKILKLLDKIT
ncbi:lysosomal acid lipase/cholesteryl ester hydrolase-like [Cylas formicarius]|uniref:lysosomal acid lipase/cholesteryl ester hydrolase-like n=1 Tax=Cylas formicarius TaxID=197179 RepID=UPI0029589813|nr:lysosomal acid lipase/cholesteryl ester hydrolase-like [Cylas formicarius]